MSVIETKYYPGRYGLATEYSLAQMPIDFLRGFTNRFLNIRGDAEKRQGIRRLGAQISGAPTITGLHEYVDNQGNSTVLASANGNIYKYSDLLQTWSTVLTGKDSGSRLLSVQMAGKLIFVNGVDRNFYTDDAGVTFKELKAIVETGVASSTATNATSLSDAQITNWLSTFVTNNDIIYNNTKQAYGIVTSVGATNLSCSPIGSAATGIGFATQNQQSSDIYEVLDGISLNVIPIGNSFDNFATITSGSSTTQVRVSGVNFANTEAKVGDFVYNTTRNALTAITAVSANLNVTAVSGQTVNDSVTFHKSAMPISVWPHVHNGSLYLIDARNRGQVRISGPADPQDFTTNQNTLEATTLFYDSRQPQAEILLSLKTFQQYLVAGGQRNIYADAGTLTTRTSGAAINSNLDFSPIGLFPQGCVSRFGLESIGGACVFAANDGLRNFNANFNANTFQTTNISESIKSELAALIVTELDASTPDEIQTIHYPRRNWLMYKIGDQIYNYNYTPYYSQGQVNSSPYGSWSKFTGKFAQQKTYLVRKNGDLICAGANGRIYEFDHFTYDDDGDTIPTSLETGFLNLSETQEGTTMKSGVYIKPVFETTQTISYSITATGGYNNQTTDTITATSLGGQNIFYQKYPLRWKGEKFRVRIDTDTATGPDVITGFYIYGNILGKV